MLLADIMTSPPADREPSASISPAQRSRPPLLLTAGRTSVVFTWHGDRWRHSVSIDGMPVASSQEHTADSRDQSWPASPPLVELSPLETPNGPAILAVGLAGRSHYSASIVPHPVEPDTLLVEIACRLKEPPGWLGSTYDAAGETVRVTAHVASIADLPATVCWSYALGPAGIRALPPAAVARCR
jgi:hypothetical protein